jgi:hypothetical protein
MRAKTIMLATRLLTPHDVEYTRETLSMANVPHHVINDSEHVMFISQDSKRFDALGERLRISLADNRVHQGGSEEIMQQRSLAKNVVTKVMRNPKLIITGLIPFLGSRYGEVIIGSYSSVLFQLFKDLFNMPLDDIVDEDYLASWGQDILDVTIDNGWFVANEVTRFSLCQIPSLFISLMRMIPIVGVPFKAIPISVIEAFSPCPPPSMVDDNYVPTQRTDNYLNDIIKCDLSAPCTMSADCRGAALCKCNSKNMFVYHSIALDIDEDEPCDSQGGKCMCWPSLACGAAPRPINWTGAISGLDMCHVYGYEIERIVWYKEPNYRKRMENVLNNTWVSVEFATRRISYGFNVTSPMYAVGAVVFFVSPMKGIVLVGGLLIIDNYMPKISKFVENTIVTIAVNLKNKAPWPFHVMAEWVLDLSRFPNHTPEMPLGEPRMFETACFFVNIWSALQGIGVCIAIGSGVIQFLTGGMLFGIIDFIYQVGYLAITIIFIVVPSKPAYENGNGGGGDGGGGGGGVGSMTYNSVKARYTQMRNIGRNMSELARLPFIPPISMLKDSFPTGHAYSGIGSSLLRRRKRRASKKAKHLHTE